MTDVKHGGDMSSGACTITLSSGKEYTLALAAEDVLQRLQRDPSAVSQVPQRSSTLGLWVRHDAVVSIEEVPTRRT